MDTRPRTAPRVAVAVAPPSRAASAAVALIDSFDGLKTIPVVALRAAELCADPECAAAAVEAVLSRDPTLASRLLRLVNGPYFGLARPVSSLLQAIMLVGLKQVRNLVMAEVVGTLGRSRGTPALSRPRLWLHCTAVAVCSQMIARRILGVGGDDVFLAGLLHDIGLVVLDQAREPELGRAIELHRAGAGSLPDCERRVLDTDHLQVGLALSARWKFPAEVERAIATHHDPPPCAASGLGIGDVVAVAHFLARELGFPEVADAPPEAPGWVAEHVAEQELEYQALVRDFAGEMTKAELFFEPSSSAVPRRG